MFLLILDTESGRQVREVKYFSRRYSLSIPLKYTNLFSETKIKFIDTVLTRYVGADDDDFYFISMFTYVIALFFGIFLNIQQGSVDLYGI